MKKMNLDQLKVNSFITRNDAIEGGKRGNCYAAPYTQACTVDGCQSGGLDDGLPNRL